jgi:hypothetical protein
MILGSDIGSGTLKGRTPNAATLTAAVSSC